jgi:hypothetical protein
MEKFKANPTRRWKDVPKEELDGGPLTEIERLASEDRKKNKGIEGRRKAAKKKTSG